MAFRDDDEKKKKKDDRPWYEQPGVKIRNKYDEDGRLPEIDWSRQGILELLEHVRGEGRTVDEILQAMSETRDGLLAKDEEFLVLWESFESALRRLVHVRRNLFKFLKIADRQGLIEQAL
jgi:hypothetical protein